MAKITRRGFLVGAGMGAGVAALGLSFIRLRQRNPEGWTAPPTLRTRIPEYQSFEDLYRQKWTWDKIAKGTHAINCWYQRGCCWNVYVKDGVVFREEQAAIYEQTNPDVPDYNPRGCQKGACYSARMIDKSRLLHPLKRVGKRGEGKWKRVSWDEALGAVADATLDALVADGAGSVVWDPGTGNANGCNGIGAHRTGFVLDTPMLNVNCEVGDHHPGAMATVGKISFSNSMDDLHYSDLILIWGCNPTFTQIPNAHFINEARYHGARIVSIVPDYNASSIHADEWIPVRTGSDAAFGLAMAQVMIEEGIYDAGFIAEQTDMPLLVREDTKRFLRQSDLEKNGDESIFYCFDKKSGEVREVNRRSLALKKVEPALEGAHRVGTLAGEVRVTTVFELLRKQLASYTPEATGKITGVRPEQMRRLARRIAGAKAATFIANSSFGKYYHGLEMERAQILVLTLCGQLGKKGSGICGFPAMNLAGASTPIQASASHSLKTASIVMAAKMAPEFVKRKLAGDTDEMILNDIMREEQRHGPHLTAALYLYYHAGVKDLYGGAAKADPHMKRETASFLEEAIGKGWQIPPPKAKTRVFLAAGGNILRRARGQDRLVERFVPSLDLLATFDWRMSNTALYSDYVFPAAGWYEKDDITWATPLAPFAHVTTEAVPPLAESKSDWQFHCLFLKMLQARAVERGLANYLDRAGKERRLDNVYDEFTFHGRYHEDNVNTFMKDIIEVVSNLNGATWEQLKEKGFERYSELGIDPINIGNSTDFKPGETITCNTWHTEKKTPWPTLTRRMQFYIDHPFYLELGEELPVHKNSPKVGGDYPLTLTCQHNRWSIHASWRDEQHLLRLQRGTPLIYMSRDDAAARGISDGDRARVHNDHGAFLVDVKVADSVRPGMTIVNHAWEAYHFEGRKSYQSLTPSPMNPVLLAGGYTHLQPTPIQAEAGTSDRDTRIEVERVSAA